MKNFLSVLLIVVMSMAMGAYLHKCQSPPTGTQGRGCEVDTIICHDTITHYEPVSTSTSQLGFKFIRIPVLPYRSFCAADTLPYISADTEVGEMIIEACDTNADSMTLALPVVQEVYEDSTYKAYVSGIYPRLDSIFVYAKREVLTIKKPPKRWHIGPTIGFGITPEGLQPYAGISITYSVIQF